MTNPATQSVPAGPAPLTLSVRRREHIFYPAMAAGIALTVLGGFAPTYYLRPLFGHPPLPWLVHIHGFVFTSWIVLFAVQTSLIATNRTRIHRRLGVAGAVLAALVVVLGTTTAIYGANHGAGPPGIPPLVFLAIPLGDMVVFATLAGAGLRFRRRPDVHKRLMLLATIGLLAAPIARIPFPMRGPLVFFGLADLFLVPCVLFDLATRGRVHRATALGALLIVASQPLRLMISGTDGWMAFARWVTGA